MSKKQAPNNSTKIGETALAEEIRVELENARKKPEGRERDKYFEDKVFPLFDRAHGLGYSVEPNSTGVYELRKVEGKWEHPTIRRR